ncbi:MAG: hypothetical protein Cpurp_10005 [Chlorogloea purpurea SAG 13.99]|nr:hypothetical protein [Chlorogloea purpurea SAG 13.99]
MSYRVYTTILSSLPVLSPQFPAPVREVRSRINYHKNVASLGNQQCSLSIERK